MNKKELQQQLIIALASPHLIQLCEKLLKYLSQEKIISHLVMTDNVKSASSSLFSLADYYYDDKDIAASIASGSFKTAGLIILGYNEALIDEIFTGVTKTLIARAADVILKERRRLVYVIEKTPWDSQMLEQFDYLSELDCIIFPLVTTFYNQPQSIDEMIHHSCARVMDLFGFHLETKRWPNQ